MQNLSLALSDYFRCRNYSWLSGDCQPLAAFAEASRKPDWLLQAAQSALRQRTCAKERRMSLVRAHTRVHVQKVEKGPSGEELRALIVEQVTWVYFDGRHYFVEARYIDHVQHWAYTHKRWVMLRAAESDELHPLRPSPQLVEAADARKQSSQAPSIDRSRPSRFQCLYNRVQAHRFAELWWNGCNQSFLSYANDGTNFVSQCLLAGGMPMSDGIYRHAGWWHRFEDLRPGNPHSDSWVDAQALYRYLVQSVRAVTVNSPRDLKVGDIVFYDWLGEGRFTHSAIVVDFDSRGDALVNAHSQASRHRHYKYLDSRAWTRWTRYGLLHIPTHFPAPASTPQLR